MNKQVAGLSCNVVLDSKLDRNGLQKVYFRIKDGKVKRDIFTGVRWPRCYFDKITQQLFPRFKNDPDVVPSNLRLNEYKAVAHRLRLSGYLKDNQVTVEDLVKEFSDIGKTGDFFAFMKRAADDLYNDDIIVYGTYSRHKSSLNVLKEYYRGTALPFSKIDLDFIKRFDAWAKKVKKRKHNTVCGYHKDIKKYLGIALRKCLIAKNHYDDFTFAYVDGDRQALTKEEIGRLYKFYNNPEAAENDRDICRRFLFSCVTGLRISDTSRVHANMIIDNQIVFVAYKGRQKGKVSHVPLSAIAKSLIGKADGLIFTNFSHSYINERLKIIAGYARIYKRLTYHCARDTFGTMFIEMGGDIVSLKDLMGHKSMKTTAIYVKMSDKRKQQLMNNFDQLFGND